MYLDINECKTNNGGCPSLCINSVGSYTCSCQDGFDLASDGKTCIGMYNVSCVQLTLSQLVSSADNLCKQFGLRSGPTKCRVWSGSNCLTRWLYSWNNILKKNDFGKISRRQKSMQNYPVGKELKHIYIIVLFLPFEVLVTTVSDNI